MEPAPPALEGEVLTPQTAREVPLWNLLTPVVQPLGSVSLFAQKFVEGPGRDFYPLYGLGSFWRTFEVT